MRQAILWITLVFFISACSNSPTKQTFNRAANTHIQTISVLHPPKVEDVQVVILTHPGQSFGLIGGLIAAADMSSKTDKYNKKVQGKVDWEQYTLQQLTNELGKAGYQLKTVKARDKKDSRGFMKKYPTLSADAILDYHYAVGQIASGATTNYVPSVRINARLTDLKNKTVLYEQSFSAGLATNQSTVHFPIQGSEYKNINELLANSDESLESLKNGIQQIAQRIASDLKK